MRLHHTTYSASYTCVIPESTLYSSEMIGRAGIVLDLGVRKVLPLVARSNAACTSDLERSVQRLE